MENETGFLDFPRTKNYEKAPKERIKNFNEFKIPLSDKERKEQASRCMDCGVPFCQSGMILDGKRTGCPLNNLIPEINDEVKNGHWAHALSRLTKTNNFPEFTGRVCPALCECACSNNLLNGPVTVHDNELAIIEFGFENGLIDDTPPSVLSKKSVAVVGSGPAGLCVADMLRRRGHGVTVFERDDNPGGLLMYGIPNMKLDKSVVFRRIDVLKHQGVKFELNHDIKTKADAKNLLDTFDAVVITAGAKKPRSILNENAKGVVFAVDFLKSTTSALLKNTYKNGDFISAKGKNVVIVGGGDTGNDCVATAIRHGAKSVTQLEMLSEPPLTRPDDNPWPEYPKSKKTDYGQEEAIAVFGHDPRIFDTTVTGIKKDESNQITGVCTVKLSWQKDEKTDRMKSTPKKGSETTLPCDLLLVAAGFLGCEDTIFDSFEIEKTPRGVIKSTLHRTSNEKVFCAGDCKNGQSLVCVAISDARKCAKEVDEFLMGYTNMIE